jgi:hypothetical protein
MVVLTDSKAAEHTLRPAHVFDLLLPDGARACFFAFLDEGGLWTAGEENHKPCGMIAPGFK